MIAVLAGVGELRRAASRHNGRVFLTAFTIVGCFIITLPRQPTPYEEAGAAPAPRGGERELRAVGRAHEFQADLSAASAQRPGQASDAAEPAANEAARAALAGTERFALLDSAKEQFVYSAHYDDRTSHVQIVGFKHRFEASASRPLWCRYSDGRGNVTLRRMEVYFNVSTFYPKDGLLYNTFIWRCAVTAGGIPRSVDLVDGPAAVAPVTLRVLYTPRPREPALFGVCVKPMVNYSNLNQLVEFVEVHRLFGVSKFIIYDYSHSPVIDEALDYYVSRGVIVIHRWPLPVPLDTVHDHGQKSMNHHCLMTYLNVFKHIAFIDLDEILVPISPASTWSDIITAAKTAVGSKASDGAYVFLSSIFPREVTNYTGLDCGSQLQPCNMATLVNSVRSGFYPIGSWSKPMVEARKTDIVDIHIVRRMIPEYTVLEVNPSVAFLHHYRSVAWPGGGVPDNGTEPFRADIIKAVGKMLAAFNRNPFNKP